MDTLTGPDPGDDAGTPATSWVLAATLIPSTSALLACVDPRLRHWFLIPVTVCGVLIGVDAFEWLRRRRDVFDPQAILGLFGVHFYYLAPVLHVLLDYWPPLLHPSAAGWRSALGAMALLNMVGLVVYRVVLSLPGRGPLRAVPSRLDPGRYQSVALMAVVVGVLAFGVEVLLLGGPGGFFTAMTQDRTAFAGLGWLLLISESFPLLLFCLVLVRWRQLLRRRVDLVVLLLVGLVAVQFLVGGLRGSRSAVLWPLVLGLVLVHLLVRPITRRTFVASAVAVVMFVYAYGLYKGAGVEVVDIAKGTRTVEEVSAETGRDLPTVLLADLGRADIQALLLNRQRVGVADWSYGSTYVAAPLLLVPGSVGAERVRSKSAVGTDVLYGPGVYASGVSSQRVFGITGEAILNFGPVGGLLSFVFLGLFLRFATRYYARARQSDALAAKLLCLPLCAITVILVTADLDNILAFYLGEALPLALVVLCAVARSPRTAVGHRQYRQSVPKALLASNQRK
ncbi:MULTISPECIES: hypothetical protein [unclassified Solwaraspora]|uniref:hypothetical protein n=1 Tax=unclassified Solwaraspora TaxID=2627926 RepID=UPI00248B640D|nr:MULTISPECIES: hypothetical protein [unclassified Solwaraspora]WBB95462.1 hypothetical protein O7553_19000 [Solwaraspora sp. WMMA2059]WBC20633.1 hypothetical protein O7543_28365 [Solwaraspora sp. WMMA2080]WJK37236.1 hypothetical protein O7610_13320 [Solwaraspora sp. WMMA2065]